MAEELTEQQKQAVMDRGGDLLVSAAAGSGKTKVLVDRLMRYLTDPVDPANIDEFLIITYTKAAASELRGKIAAKLSERIAQEPENRHLQQQLQRLYMTTISTVHSFCGDLLRQFAYRLDLSADFRVADENECKELRNTVMRQVLDRAYDTAGEDEDFCAFVDSQGVKRNDNQLPELLLKVFDSALCHLNPEGWLDGCLEAVNTEGITDVSQTRWGEYLMEQLKAYLDLQIAAIEHCAELAAQAEGGEKPAALLHDTAVQLRFLRDSKTWDEIIVRKNIQYGKMSFSKKFTDEELKQNLKVVRDACKDGVKDMLSIFSDSSEQILCDLRGASAAVRSMVKLVRDFEREFTAAKRHRRILDFSDLEHRTLDLLLGKRRSAPTAIAHEIGARFREVMVDEYQDSNAVQDAIYSALTEKKHNCFMVGDVKQSIYQFRLADPSIFLKKYAAFAPAEKAIHGEGRKVMLSKNFRSGGAVLSAVNCVFETCMSPEVGGLHYGSDEALHEGLKHEPLGEAEVEFYALQVREETYPEEAAFVASRIRELLDGTHMVRDKEGLRPIRPEDIMILLRSPNTSGEYYRQALERSGIRCSTGGGGDLLKTDEVAVLRSLLQVVLNPQLDIPLLSVLASPLFGFTADDLAAVRGSSRKYSVYDSLRASQMPKAEAFLALLNDLRRESGMSGLSDLLETIFVRTRIDIIYGAMPDGDVRAANLQAFYQFAVSFEAGGQKDLGRFLEHLEVLSVKGINASADNFGAGSVGIMSIHKSKGLEYPVVILAGLSKSFNSESSRANVMCHKHLGIGISAADSTRRVRYPTISKRAISEKIASDGVSEELRILYVAMTRARDRLIMTYADQYLEKHLTEMVVRTNMNTLGLLTQEASCLGHWVLLSALHRTEAGELFKVGGQCVHARVWDHPWLIKVVESPEQETVSVANRSAEEVPLQIREQLRSVLAFHYPNPEATTAPSKQTATQRKGRIKDQEAAENAPEPKTLHRSWRKPSFVEAQPEGKTHGSAVHAAMQHLRYEGCTDSEGVKSEIERLVAERFITEAQAKLIDHEKIARFFQTSLGRKLSRGENVLREFKFSILDDGTAYDPALQGEQILLQGVVDCALIEDDGITVIDFKTDRVTSDTINAAAQRYRPQVEAYADALRRIFKKPIKKTCLYFFQLEQFVDM